MRAFAVIAALTLLAPLVPAADKLSMEDRVELTRGLTAEYANAKVLVPRSKKPLEFDAKSGSYDKKEWSDIAKVSGPAARTGDTIQVTKVEIGEDRIVLQLNGGFKGGVHWYDGVRMQGGMGGQSVPVSGNSDSNAPAGTSVVVLFHKSLEGVKAAEVKKLLAPVLDFDRHSVTEIYSETLPPEVQNAIKQKRALVGMDRDQVKLAMGQPVYKSRETKDGMDQEDWVYGKPPGKITFVTFQGEKAIKVKEDYAGLGTEVGPVK
jgi:hypothetical protein